MNMRNTGRAFRFGGDGVKVLPALNVNFEKPKDMPLHGEFQFIFSIYGDDGSDLSANVNVGKFLSGSETNVEGEFTLGYVRQILGKREMEGFEGPGYNMGL